MEALSQVQIIRSLAQALDWFEKELSWGTPASQLSHLTGRIGELYVAMITRGQMASRTNQRGYDVISGENERISVKTFTTSTHVSFNANTFSVVDRVMIIRIDTDPEEGILITEYKDLTGVQARESARPDRTGKKMRISTNAGQNMAVRDTSDLSIVQQAKFEPYEILQFENGTIHVREGENTLPTAKPALRRIAAILGVDIEYDEGKQKNTRQLGAHILKALSE